MISVVCAGFYDRVALHGELRRVGDGPAGAAAGPGGLRHRRCQPDSLPLG